MRNERYIVVAEKASVARAIKSAIGPAKADVVVTSVRGHLMNADLPPGYEWGSVDPSEIIKLRRVVDKVSDTKSYNALRKLFAEGGVLVVATDNDSEGELIGYEVLQVFRDLNGSGECYRMRFNSLNRRELLQSWANLEKGLNWRWVEKARFRQIFDLITGASFTRLLTLAARSYAPVRLISWGSCQTPTLNFVVEREREISSFKPQKYWFIEAVLKTEGGEEFKAYTEKYVDKDAADKLFENVKGCSTAFVEDFRTTEKTLPRPLPMRTDDVLRDLTRLTKLSANKLLEMLETLYSEGYISYPRTDTNRYRRDFDFETARMAVVESKVLEGLPEISGKAAPRNGAMDDGAHPPIYPTAAYGGGGLLGKIWEYVARRFYANAYAEDAVQQTQKAAIKIADVSFFADGRMVVKPGYMLYYPYFKPADQPVPQMRPGQVLTVVEVRLVEGETKPPPRLDEAELLRLMEKNGIGTDATRATYPSLIVERRYASRQGGRYRPTLLGLKLVESLEKTDRRLVTPDTRKMVEQYMEALERGEAKLEECLETSLKTYGELLRLCRQRALEIGKHLAEAYMAETKAEDRKRDRFTKTRSHGKLINK
jgi:DNA topoisomerase IA